MAFLFTNCWRGVLRMVELLIFLVLFQIRHMIIIAYLHRDLCHRSITYSPAFAQFTRILQWMSSSGPGSFDLQYNADWAFTHKAHHKHADTEQDPYWPIMLQQEDPLHYPTAPVKLTKLDEFLEDRPYGNVILLLLAILFMSWPLVIFAMLVRWTPRWRMIWANYVYHKWPGHAWDTGKERCNARNLYWGPLVFMGEELHANHHQWPSRANFGIKWWEIDLSYWFFKLLSFLKLVEIRQSPDINSTEFKLVKMP
jgi:stearoyl-CoA desaturase (delta-9 desaturase)